MSNLLTKIQSIRSEDEKLFAESIESAQSEIYDIAIRDYFDSPEDGDAEVLIELLQTLQISEADYQRMVEAVGLVCNAAAEMNIADKKSKTQSADSIEAQRNMIIADQESKRWQRRVNDLQTLRSHRSSILANLQTLRDEFPEFFDEDGKARQSLEKEIGRCEKEKLEYEAAQAAEGEQPAGEPNGSIDRDPAFVERSGRRCHPRDKRR